MANITDPDRIATAGARLRGAVVAVVLLALAAPPAASQAPAPAATDDAFVIDDVSVSATAETATAARDKAIADGHVAAYQRLVERIVPQADRARAPLLGTNGVARLVRSFEIDDERRSDVRYTATLRFLFNPEAVRRTLRDAGITVAEVSSQPVLVLPVLRAEGRALLWEDANDWRAAWADDPSSGDAAQFLVPLGDLADVRDVSAEQAIAGDARRLRAIGNRYGSSAVLVAVATIESERTGGIPVLQVGSTRHGAGAQETTLVTSIAAQRDEPRGAFLKRAAALVRKDIETGGKGDATAATGAASSVVVTVPVGDLAEWLTLQRRIGAVPLVRASELVSITRGEAVVRLGHIGDEAQLADAFAAAGLDLARGISGAWTLRAGGGGQRSAVPGEVR
ncbi:MAG: DUF2066 domain-containing protein [Alphaproteobacteria bacterium]|nr:DUF2066 domain-containing protein [Alphaproteobacteria bacterium]